MQLYKITIYKKMSNPDTREYKIVHVEECKTREQTDKIKEKYNANNVLYSINGGDFNYILSAL